MVEIDYASKRLRLHDPNTYEYVGRGESIPISLVGGHVYVDLVISLPDGEPIDCHALVDTGAGASLLFTRPFTQKHDALSTLGATVTTSGLGVGGESRAVLGRIESLKLGSFLMTEPIAAFSLDEKGFGASADVDAVLGASVLRRFTVIFDYARSRMILEPNHRLHEPFTADLLGADWGSGSDGDWNTVHVSRVRDESAAQIAGIQPADVLVTVDGKPASKIGIPALREYFQNAGQIVHLTLRRNGREFECVIKLEKLL